MRLVMTIAALALALPAAAQQSMIEGALRFQELRDKTEACYGLEIDRLDDRRSDASTIARAARQRCRDAEIEEITGSTGATMDVAREVLVRREVETSARVIALVLEARARSGRKP